MNWGNAAFLVFLILGVGNFSHGHDLWGSLFLGVATGAKFPIIDRDRSVPHG